jgi:cell division protein FtsW
MTEKIKNNHLANYIAMVIVTLMAIGAIFVFSADASLNQKFELQNFYKFPSLRQIMFFPLACIIMFSASAINYKVLSFQKGWFKSPVCYLVAISIILLGLVLIPSIGIERNFARRWLGFTAGSIMFTFQPSELAKWSAIFFVAAFCDKYADSIKLFKTRLLPLCLIIGIVIGLIVIEDLGTAVLICVLTFFMLMVAGARYWHILAPIPLGIVGFLGILFTSPYRMNRIMAFLHPDQWIDKINYQPNQSLIAIGSGGVLGKGLGMGVCKYGHLPEDTTDFIFAIIAEEMGLAGTIAVILLFIILTWLGMLVVGRCKDHFGRLLASGITLAIAMQAAINIGVVTVVLPTKGIPLPFVSSGGTSILISAAAAGVLINIAKQSPKPNSIEAQLVD